jgi:hypothetical protein
MCKRKGEDYGLCAGFSGIGTPVRQLKFQVQTSEPDGRPWFKTDRRSAVTDRLARLKVMLRHHLATSPWTEPHDDDDGAFCDAADDGPSARLRSWARPFPPRVRLEKPPPPGSARGPAPPALRRIAPQSTGKQFASYPSPSRFCDGEFRPSSHFRLSYWHAISSNA